MTLSRDLALRTVPIAFNVPSDVLSSMFGNHAASWLYEVCRLVDLEFFVLTFQATNDGSYNTTLLPWSSSEWAFVPVDFSLFGSSNNQTNQQQPASQEIEITAPAIRGRIECTQIDTSDTTAWLNVLQFSQRAAWNDTTIPKDLRIGYELKAGMALTQELSNGTSKYWSDSHPYFSFFATNAKVQCCGNESSDATLGEAAVAYWSPPADNPSQGIVVKWVTGYAFGNPFLDANNAPHWVWEDKPQLTALNCTPVFETANADVGVDVATGIVKEFSLLSDPIVDLNAWTSNYEKLDDSQAVNVRYDFAFQ